MENTSQTSPKDLEKWQASLHSTQRLRRNLTLTKKRNYDHGHTQAQQDGLTPPLNNAYRKSTRVDSLFPNLTKTSQSKSSTFHQNIGKHYSLAPPTDSLNTKNRKIHQVHSQILRHRPHKYSQTPIGRISDMTTIILTKLTGRITNNQSHNRGNRNRSQQNILQAILGHNSSDKRSK